ncbi:cellulase family glycosylhydrolase [Balneola sp. MJW-20]|uniref:cellulase family glycosylhydrolase n=1 Tax=Gracilimonas aurantiaca TaxID=3234185 RepID=UPI003466C7F8
MKNITFLILFPFFMLTCSTVNDSGSKDDNFWKTNGPVIQNQEGRSVVIRGVGLGGWLMPEGYMLDMALPDGGSPTSIKNAIIDLIGEANYEEFNDLYIRNYVNEKDIEQIAEWGYDHIRLPFHYNVLYDIDQDTFKEDGFQIVDEFIQWCKNHDLYIILDMHAAPGAQNHLNISDSDGVARLWVEPSTYQPITVKIWEEIARRYKDETQIIGYDLINEPVLPANYSKASFRQFYETLSNAVRTIDKNHILFIEGDWFATDFTGLTPPWDGNMVYAFHKYWNETDAGTYQYLMDIRTDFQVPLWLGESGENSNVWFNEVTRGMESNNIGWNWWTHKKYNTISAPLSVPKLDQYEVILEYFKGNGPRPSAQEAYDGFMQLARNLHIDSTIVKPDVVAALFSPDFSSTNVPYTDLEIPGTIEAEYYDIGSNSVSYFDTQVKRVSDNTTGNNGWTFRNDGVDIQVTEDTEGNGYNVGWIGTSEWMEYTVDVSPGTYTISARVATPSTTASINISLDGATLISNGQLPRTGSYQNWQTVDLGSVTINEGGKRMLRVSARNGGYNLNFIEFK